MDDWVSLTLLSAPFAVVLSMLVAHWTRRVRNEFALTIIFLVWIFYGYQLQLSLERVVLLETGYSIPWVFRFCVATIFPFLYWYERKRKKTMGVENNLGGEL
ncbi:hypothetical protein ACFL13_00275 [Patescibacteria group bacterium]